MELSRELIERPGLTEILETLAAVAAADDPRTGAVLIGAADACAPRRATRQPDEEDWVLPVEATLREALGEEAFAAARRGRRARPRGRRRPGLERLSAR